jgi:hypothetical protein
MLFQHHVNLVSLLFCAHYAFYINSKFSHFDSPVVNDVLCKASEFTWMMLNFLRLYSLLALAVYRYIAVHHIQLFRKIKLLGILMMIGSSWAASLVLSLVLKFSLSTTYSKWYCTDGFNENINMTIVYYALRTLLATVMPSCIIIALYKKILTKVRVSMNSTLSDKRLTKINVNTNRRLLRSIALKVAHNKINFQEPTQNGTLENDRTVESIRKVSATALTSARVNLSGSRPERNKNFARQILLMNVIVIIASVFSVMVSLNLVLISYSDEFFFIHITSKY